MDLSDARLGRYEIQDRIGRGGMAVVYKGWDTTLERPVAVKVLHEHLTEDKDFRSRFEREAKVVASLDHPNIVQVYDFAMMERNKQTICYMVMKFIPGQSLKALMEADAEKRERLTLSEITNIMTGVCSALDFAHSRGMVHRDVTPGNILFDEQRRAVLADFGIARMVNSQRVTQSGTTSGTPLYMAPEQGIGQAGDHRSDLYSLGIILYEMLTGRTPFEGESAYAVLLKHINDPVPSPLKLDPSLPKALEPVLLRALDKDPESRFPSAADMLTAYLAAVGSPDATRQQNLNRTVMMEAQRVANAPAPRPRWLLPALGGTGLLLIVGVGLALQVINPSPPPTVTLIARDVKTRFAPSMTASAILFTETFADGNPENIRWPITTDDPDITREVVNGEYRVSHRLPNAAVTTLFYPGATYGTRYVYAADFRLSEANASDAAAGIVFRFQDDDHYYVFAVNGLGQVSIWVRTDGEWIELRGLNSTWTDTTAAKRRGQLNRLRLVDSKTRLQAYVNDVLVIDIENEPKINSGLIGIYLASSTSTVAREPFVEVFVDNFSASELPKSTPVPNATVTSTASQRQTQTDATGG
jgi:serine/threonine protein kinase